MPDTSDRPFGHHTVKLRALFVPEGSEDQVSRADAIEAVGSEPLKIPAVFVAEGEARPGPSYVHVGQVVFRPDPGAAADQSGPNSQPRQPAEQPEEEQSGGGVVMPPNPAPGLGNGDPFAAGMAAWRTMTDVAGGSRRRSLAAGPGGNQVRGLRRSRPRACLPVMAPVMAPVMGPATARDSIVTGRARRMPEPEHAR